MCFSKFYVLRRLSCDLKILHLMKYYIEYTKVSTVDRFNDKTRAIDIQHFLQGKIRKPQKIISTVLIKDNQGKTFTFTFTFTW